MLRNNIKQKSLNGRFLLILGAASCVSFLALGFMLIFWDRFGFSLLQRISFGVLVIAYGVFRFVRLLNRIKEEDE